MDKFWTFYEHKCVDKCVHKNAFFWTVAEQCSSLYAYKPCSESVRKLFRILAFWTDSEQISEHLTSLGAFLNSYDQIINHVWLIMHKLWTKYTHWCKQIEQTVNSVMTTAIF